MQFNVAQLLKEVVGTTRKYELAEALDDLDPELKSLGLLRGMLQLLRTPSGVLARGEFSIALQVTCSRCVEPIAVPVQFTIEESFRPLTEVSTGRYISPSEFLGVQEDLEDEALLISEHHILDISEIVRQNVWLALPMYPTCNWEGVGECPNLTTRLQEMRDVHSDLDVDSSDPEGVGLDPRWSVLRDLQDKLSSEI